MATRIARLAVLVTTPVILAACGGGAGGAVLSRNPGVVAGAVTKGPVHGALVTAYAVEAGMRGRVLGSGRTDASGRFSFPIESYAGAMTIEAAGGDYADEATGSTMPMHSGDVMTCALPAVAAGGATTGVQVTPLTTMAQAMAAGMAGGMTADHVAAANADVGAYFSVDDILHTAPMDPTVSGAGAGATTGQVDYGMALAAMSQYAKDVGMTDSSGMVTAMREDASDGVMNGAMGGTSISMSGMGGMMGGMMQPTAGTTGLSTAMSEFVGSSANRSGVTAGQMQPLVDKLAGSSGALVPAT